MQKIKQKILSWKCSFYGRRAKKIAKRYAKCREECGYLEQEIIDSYTEYGREKAWHEKYIKSKAYLAIVIGILMLILTLMLSYVSSVSVWDERKKALCQALVTALNSVFSIIIGIGISTLVLDFFGYVKYTRERIKEIMIDKKYIQMLSEEEKKDIIDICERSLYFKNGGIVENSLYANIKELIIPLIEVNYYQQYKVHVDCYVNEKENVIHKKVHKIMDIVCVDDQTEFKIPFSTYLTKIEGVKDEELYKLNECILNGEDITDKVKDKIIPGSADQDENVEDIKFSLDYVFPLKKGLNRIEIRTETMVPINDNTYAHTITIPCKRYSANFALHNSTYDVLGFAFAFDDAKNKKDTDRIIYRDKYDDCYKIRFESWTLPGDGVVFMVNKKTT